MKIDTIILASISLLLSFTAAGQEISVKAEYPEVVKKVSNSPLHGLSIPVAVNLPNLHLQAFTN